MSTPFKPAPRRSPAVQTELSALYVQEDPLASESPYHAFARAPPSAVFGKPKLWPGPEAAPTTARLLWNSDALFILFECEGRCHTPVSADAVEPAALEKIQVQPDQRTVLLDERVECFISQASGTEWTGQSYYAFEVNFGGKALTSKVSFGAGTNRGEFDFGWGGPDFYTCWTEELAVGCAATASPIPGMRADGPVTKRVLVLKLLWKSLGMDPSKDVHIGLHRAAYPSSRSETKLQQADVDRIQGSFVWSSCIDPCDDLVNFHRRDFFAKLTLLPQDITLDCSCCAARMFSPKKLRVVRSPVPSLDECPQGTILVRAKYASICGSDMPYFRSQQLFPPSCYWDRDGFCGHEVIGIVLQSKSDRFKPGDPVMALPSSYFKAHAGSKQDWYKEEVHGVLLQDFPVRGGFSQVYTSHELYSYALKECTPHMLAAQALGTILKLFRKLGTLIGKTVVVVGLGQNGLIATRMASQLCADYVLAVEPLEYRRNLASKFGADSAVSPEEAVDAILAITGGRRADVVIEMVGHNQDTVNQCIEYAACSGTVAVFGVPDDPVYNRFDFSKAFRKNLKMVFSVIPDPQTDFPEAVRLIERGRFDTEGIFTHTVPLKDIDRGFQIASSYEDNVVKLVIDMDS